MPERVQTFTIAKIRPTAWVGKWSRQASGYSTASPGSRAASWRSPGKSFRAERVLVLARGPRFRHCG
jgi:hypothetical protein